MQVPGSNRLIVVGGSVTGAYTAIAGAKAGYSVTLVEKFPEVASRRTVFNLAPTVADSLKRLDDGGDELVDALQVIVSRRSDDIVNGQVKVENAGERILADHTRPLTADALIDGFTGADPRPWGRVQVAGIENHMRRYLAQRYPQVEVRYGQGVEAISQSRDGVTAHLVDEMTGAKDSVDGAWLVSATGGRNPLGVRRENFPEVAHFVGGLLEPVTPDRVQLARAYRLGEQLDPRTVALNPAGEGFATVSLPGTGRPELPHSLVWAQVAEDARNVDIRSLRQVVRDRADVVGLEDVAMLPGADAIMPVNVQLGLLREPAVRGRVLLAGDELVGPYFPSSTGAGHAIGVNAPLLEDTLRALRRPGANTDEILRRYDERARAEAAKVVAVGRDEMLEDLGLPRRGAVENHLADLDAAAAAASGESAAMVAP